MQLDLWRAAVGQMNWEERATRRWTCSSFRAALLIGPAGRSHGANGSAARCGGADASRNHLVSEHWKVKDDSLAPRVLAEGGAIGFLEHAGGVLLLRLAVLELR